MDTRRWPFRALVVLAGVLAAACSSGTSDDTAAGAERSADVGSVLSVGTIADDPREEVEIFTPFFGYVSDQMSDVGYSSSRIVVAGSMTEMADLVASGEVDVYLDSVYPMAVVGSQVDIDVSLRRWKGGVQEYHSVLFVRADSGIETTDDLVGHMVAFEEEFSTSGFRLPLSLLTDRGVPVQELASPDSGSPDDAVGYVFSGDDENTISWVLSSSVDAGAMGVGDYNDLVGAQAEDLRVIESSIVVPRQIVAFRSNLDPSIVARVEEILLGLEATDEGRAAMESFENTARFEPFSQAEFDAIASTLLDDSMS